MLKNGKATLYLIKKTIVFIDGRKLASEIVKQVRAQLVQSTKDNPKPYKRYSYGLEGVDVFRVAIVYTLNVTKYN